MCGISGIIYRESRKVEEGEIKTINNLVKHRGPDGEGFYYGENFAFGHRRLSILDLSDLGKQPMEYGNYVITYNGEVYNYIEIRKELEKRNYQFASGSDTEVILAAYKEWGPACVSKFNGMWSFAIYDPFKKVIFCSRDRFGVKPFYYAEVGDRFVFGSEIKQPLHFINNRKILKQTLFDYLYIGAHQHSQDTFFEGVKKLLPGHNLTFDLKTSKFSIEKYYSLTVHSEVAHLSDHEAISKFKDLVYSSIQLRLRSDVKVGTCLSGGLDSSFIASIASQLYHETSGKKFQAITARSIEKESDETNYAKIIVDNSKLDWAIVEPDSDDFSSVLDNVLRIQEEPCGGPSLVMQYFVMQEANRQGCKVMLDGQGGDEILLGYERYFSTYLKQFGIFERIKKYNEIKKNSKLSLKEAFLYDLYFSNHKVRKMVLLQRGNFIKNRYSSYLSESLLKDLSTSKSVNNLQLSEIGKNQLPMLLNYEDRNSMYHSVEARVPFLDFRVVEFALSLPLNLKIRDGWTKYVLRAASKDVMPESIAWRKNKFGFNAPQKTWMSDKKYFVGNFKNSDVINTIANRDKITENLDLGSIWRLYNVARWSEAFNVSLDES